jgi:hypothetical protein
MKNYASKKPKQGTPAYRTPSRFIYKKSLEAKRVAPRRWDLAARLERRRIKNTLK